jgi:hypothetical protein
MSQCSTGRIDVRPRHGDNKPAAKQLGPESNEAELMFFGTGANEIRLVDGCLELRKMGDSRSLCWF